MSASDGHGASIRFAPVRACPFGVVRSADCQLDICVTLVIAVRACPCGVTAPRLIICVTFVIARCRPLRGLPVIYMCKVSNRE
jgi:hypothetical protein